MAEITLDAGLRFKGGNKIVISYDTQDTRLDKGNVQAYASSSNGSVQFSFRGTGKEQYKHDSGLIPSSAISLTKESPMACCCWGTKLREESTGLNQTPELSFSSGNVHATYKFDPAKTNQAKVYSSF